MAREAYRSLYSDMTKLRDQGGIQDTTAGYLDAMFQALMAVSEYIDQYCGRHFYPLTTTKLFDGDDTISLLVPDLISITTLKSDENDDKVFEVTWATTDYWTVPYNAEPTMHWGRPYTELLARSAGTKGQFKAGQQRYEIVGNWGYRQFTELSGSLITDVGGISATATTVNVTAGTDFAIGQTLLVESEQMLITNIATNALTVRRALNGTTGATHALNTALSIVRWPGPVERAAVIQASRIWARAPIFEPFYVDADLDTDVRQLLEPFRVLQQVPSVQQSPENTANQRATPSVELLTA